MTENDFTQEEKDKLSFLIEKFTNVYSESVKIAETMKTLEKETQGLFNLLQELKDQENQVYAEYSARSGDSIETAKQKAAVFLIDKELKKTN